MTVMVRLWARQWVPEVCHKPLRYAETYANRLGIWLSVMRDVRGMTVRDSVTILISVLAAPLTAARSLGKWCDPVLLRAATVRVPGVGDFNVRAESDDLYHVLPSRERAIFDAIGSMLGPGDCFVDAGANIGFYSMLAAKRVGPTGKVIAIEMMPDTADILRHHVQINGSNQIEVVEKALSDKDGGFVTAHVTEGKFGQASISFALRNPDTRAVQVEATTLDAILKDVSTVQLMKMDLEGVEELALRGAQESLENVQALIFECWTEELESIRFLAARGFSVKKLDGRNSLAIRR